MPDEVMNDGSNGVPGAGDGAASAAAPTTPVPAAQQAAPPGPPAEKTMMIPTSAMKRVREEEFSKGRQAALDQLARDAGYESNADLVSALAKLRQPAPAPQRTAPVAPAPEETPEDLATAQTNGVATRAQQRSEMAIQRNLEKALNERNRYAQSASEYRKQLEVARSEVDAVRAEMHLRTIAAGVGVQDIDYAIMLLTREVEQLTPEQAATFDERAYFDGLRRTKPLLFGETVQPATTGVGGGSAPKPPQPGQAASQQAQVGKIDARKMDPKAYQELLRARGISSVS